MDVLSFLTGAALVFACLIAFAVWCVCGARMNDDGRPAGTTIRPWRGPR